MFPRISPSNRSSAVSSWLAKSTATCAGTCFLLCTRGSGSRVEWYRLSEVAAHATEYTTCTRKSRDEVSQDDAFPIPYKSGGGRAVSWSGSRRRRVVSKGE